MLIQIWHYERSQSCGRLQRSQRTALKANQDSGILCDESLVTMYIVYSNIAVHHSLNTLIRHIESSHIRHNVHTSRLPSSQNRKQ